MKVINNGVDNAYSLFPFEHECWTCKSLLLVDVDDITNIDNSQFESSISFVCEACGSHNAIYNTEIIKALIIINTERKNRQ